MHKKIGILIVATFILGIFMQAAYAADSFAYVDLSRIFSDYNKTKDYDTVLSAKEEEYAKERDKKVDEIKKFQDKLDLLSEKEKEAKKPALEEKVKTLQNFDLQKQTDLRKDQDEKMKEILKDIEVTVQDYAKKEGFTMVFNDRVLVYQDKNLDITDKILEILNKNYKK